jgi:flagellin-like protein
MIEMNSKAISPMIATILLIAFTVAVGGIISIWMTGYTRTTGQSVSSATENQTACISSYPDIVLVTTNATIIMNRGSENITDVTCFAGNGSALFPKIDIIVPGGSNSTFWANSTGSPTPYVTGVTGFGTKVTCTGKCRSIGVSGECKSGQSCWTIT